MWETWLWSLGREDHLEKGKATHASILAWRIPWTIIVRHNWATFTFTFHSDRCEVVPVCNFDLHFSNGQWHQADYFLSIGHLGVFFGKCLFRSPTLQVDSLPTEPQGKPKNTGVGSLSLLQCISLTQGLSWGLLHCRWIVYQLSYQGICVYIPYLSAFICQWTTWLLWIMAQSFAHYFSSVWSLVYFNFQWSSF